MFILFCWTGTSNVCVDQKDCPRNALCEKLPNLKNGQCVCPVGYIIIGNWEQRECYKVASTIGESCVFHEQCMITFSLLPFTNYNITNWTNALTIL